MTQLTLTSPNTDLLRPFVQGALKRETGLLEIAVKQAQQRVQNFEDRYHLSSEQFMQQYRDAEIEETLDTIDWVGEYRMLMRLREKLQAILLVQLV